MIRIPFEIQGLGGRGHGIAEVNARRHFIANALPGETFEASDYKDELIDIKRLTDSLDRQEPICPHFGECGGCALQHMSDARVAAFKTDRIVGSLKLAKLEPKIAGVLTSPLASRRRATFSAKRTKRSAIVGFLAEGSHRLVDVSVCKIMEPELFDARHFVYEAVKVSASRSAVIKCTVTLTDTGIDAAIEGGKPLDTPADFEAMTALAREHLVRLHYNGMLIYQRQTPIVRFGQIDVEFPAQGFLQATKAAEIQMQNLVATHINPGSRVVDLFGGIGTFGLHLAARGNHVQAFESDKPSVQAFNAAAEKNGLHQARAHVRDLFRDPLTAKELSAFDVAVIDPPRAGATAQTTELAASQISRIAFISCNPLSFAKDAAVLVEAGFLMEPLTIIDQFRYSPHIETFCVFSR